MKLISPDARGQVDGTIRRDIFNYLDQRLPVTIVPLSYQPDFSFVPPRVDKKWVLVDFMEPCNNQAEYDKFWAWMKNNPPALHFKRELLKTDARPGLIPIEFPCFYEPKRSSDRAQFNARKFYVLYFWGLSHMARPILHGDIWRGMGKYGISALSHWEQIVGTDEIPADQRGTLWLCIYTPHWTRKPMNEILPIMAQTKVTVAMPGNGEKCFRHAECVDTLMAMRMNDRAWSYPWNHNNSIQLAPGNEFDNLLSASGRPDLYDFYANCCDNMAKYYAPRYAKDYVQKEIEKCL